MFRSPTKCGFLYGPVTHAKLRSGQACRPIPRFVILGTMRGRYFLPLAVLSLLCTAVAARADEAAAQELGVTGVPHFLINGAWAVPGAQDVDTLVTVLRRAWERTEV